MQFRTIVVVLVLLGVAIALGIVVLTPPPKEHEGEETPTPSGPPTPIDLSQLDESLLAQIPKEAQAILAEQHFVLVDDPRVQTFADVYDRCEEQGFTPLATTDAAIFAFFRVANWYQLMLETTFLKEDMATLLRTVGEKLTSLRQEAAEEQARQAVDDAQALLAVGARLLGQPELVPAPPALAEAVAAEVQQVKAAEGPARSPLLGYEIDYAQFAPRGLYGDCPALRDTYFPALRWLGEAVLPLAQRENGRNLRWAKCALALCKALYEAETELGPVHYVWKRIYVTESYFNGPSDTLAPERCWELAQETFGGPPSISGLADEAKVKQFAEEALAELRENVPKQLIPPNTKPREPLGISLFGRPVRADYALLAQLLLDAVGPYQGGERPFTAVTVSGSVKRGLPRGLDLAAALGFENALKLLQHDGDTEYLRYDEQLASLKNALGEVESTEWLKSIPGIAVDCVRQLAKRDEHCPIAFARSEAWPAKCLMTALGAWAELCHRYGRRPPRALTLEKLPIKLREIVPAPTGPRVCAEPSLTLFNRLQAGLGQITGKFRTLGYLSDDALYGASGTISSLLDKLDMTAAAEVYSDIELSDEQILRQFAGWFNNVFASCSYHLAQVPLHAPDELVVARVADAYVNEDVGQAVEIALGRPLVIYAICLQEGKPVLCQGAVYSVYEFKRPAADLLSDGAWRELLRSGAAPDLPSWVREWVVKLPAEESAGAGQ